MNNDLKARMAQYEQELLRMRQQGQPEAPPSPRPPVSVPPPPPPTPAPSSSVDVRVTDTVSGMPVRGAIVALDRRTGSGREPVAVRFTDANGSIAQLTVAANQPNTVYDITVAMPGYFRQRDTGIVADGTPLRREVQLVSLPEF